MPTAAHILIVALNTHIGRYVSIVKVTWWSQRVISLQILCHKSRLKLKHNSSF